MGRRCVMVALTVKLAHAATGTLEENLATSGISASMAKAVLSVGGGAGVQISAEDVRVIVAPLPT